MWELNRLYHLAQSHNQRRRIAGVCESAFELWSLKYQAKFLSCMDEIWVVYKSLIIFVHIRWIPGKLPWKILFYYQYHFPWSFHTNLDRGVYSLCFKSAASIYSYNKTPGQIKPVNFCRVIKWFYINFTFWIILLWFQDFQYLVTKARLMNIIT